VGCGGVVVDCGGLVVRSMWERGRRGVGAVG
jgi:hypothetical protein